MDMILKLSEPDTYLSSNKVITIWDFLSIFHIKTVCNPALRDNSTFTEHFVSITSS